MNKKLFIIPVLIIPILLLSWSIRRKFSRPEIETTTIWQNYSRYKEPAIKNRMFKHSDLLPLIQKHVSSKLFKSEIIGNSFQGRSISHLSIGKGKIKVLLWSQMHGDESTATMALFDIFNFLSVSDDNNTFRRFILNNLELHFVPMVNPDGAEKWKRRNALDIDLNRDARALTTPEAKILTLIADQIKPQFGFNLHDQSSLYSAGNTKHQATISFLAPAYNYSRDLNEVRTNATKLIVMMNRTLQKYAPGEIAKYNDAHEPRGFGDTFQGKGISTVLIESGGYPNDPDKQYIRKLNFYVILSALHSIAQKSYEDEDIEDYVAIPENSRFLFDLVIRNAEVTKDGYKYRASLGINHTATVDSNYKSLSYRGSLEELGDMENNFGYKEADASLLLSVPGKIKVLKKAEWDNMAFEEEKALVQQGYLFVKFSDKRSSSGPIKNRLLNLTNSLNANPEAIGLGRYPNFILTDQNKKPVYAVSNGFLVDLTKDIKALPNSFGY
ncbi:M14 family zinc carboxypeptidase [Arcticibacter eurypsychrophilus]|uniref:M14 family zinc carboxypeptidase n=1 Tax=Arcticibacter eurypsychrophilus TaxID=1434752 RepID=UPI00084DFE9A|nr:M14 family zinc carboxypeptidase [Arcticibacter eurypsychrophilus]